jgi:hypothetical protein
MTTIRAVAGDEYTTRHVHALAHILRAHEFVRRHRCV